MFFSSGEENADTKRHSDFFIKEMGAYQKVHTLKIIRDSFY